VDDRGSGGDTGSPPISATQDPVEREVAKSPRHTNVRSWRLWRLPRSACAYLIAVEVVALVATVVLAVRHPATTESVVYFVVIVGLGILAAELTRGVERMRRQFSDTPHVNMTSVWMVSAALFTTPALGATTAVVLYVHLWVRSWRRITGMHTFRTVFSASAVALSSHTVFLVDLWMPGRFPPRLTSPDGLGALVLLALTYWFVNSALVAGAIALLRSDRSLARLLGSWSENSLEFATLVVGVFTALALASFPWATVLILLPLSTLHRSVLVQQLEHAATTDTKTGLLNAGTWQSLAATELERARRHGNEVGVLMIDVDNFKAVNGRYNHMVGDQALRAIAKVLRGSVRGYDLVGRFGGEEFVILLVSSDHAGSVEVANRICARVRDLRVEDAVTGATYPELRLSVSVGVATYPDAGMTLDDVLLTADNGLFAAKDAGRDQVVAIQLSNVDHDAGRSPL
jgi:diguanylate cyclase (GGDEF)-like protein